MFLDLDEHYIDRRLVPLYDPINGERDDVGFYVDLAGTGRLDVLDAGCGTGALALALADAGHRVVGVDPATPMLDEGRHADEFDRVRWIRADARELDLGVRFDLIAMTGHAFQVFLDDTSISAFLQGARTHLRSGGRLAFETRNPLARAWQRWTPELSRRGVHIDGIGNIEWTANTLEADGELVTFEMTHRFLDTGEAVVTRSTLRFPGEETVRACLHSAGFNKVEVFGDWGRSPVLPSSSELIFVASAPA